MARIYLLLPLLAAPFLFSAPAAALPRVERGSLTFDNIPEPAAGLSEKLDAYLSARQATPLGFSPKGQLLISTRFGDVDQLHLVERPAGELRQLTFLREPIRHAAFSPDPGRSAAHGGDPALCAHAPPSIGRALSSPIPPARVEPRPA